MWRLSCSSTGSVRLSVLLLRQTGPPAICSLLIVLSAPSLRVMRLPQGSLLRSQRLGASTRPVPTMRPVSRCLHWRASRCPCQLHLFLVLVRHRCLHRCCCSSCLPLLWVLRCLLALIWVLLPLRCHLLPLLLCCRCPCLCLHKASLPCCLQLRRGWFQPLVMLLLSRHVLPACIHPLLLLRYVSGHFLFLPLLSFS